MCIFLRGGVYAERGLSCINFAGGMMRSPVFLSLSALRNRLCWTSPANRYHNFHNTPVLCSLFTRLQAKTKRCEFSCLQKNCSLPCTFSRRAMLYWWKIPVKTEWCVDFHLYERSTCGKSVSEHWTVLAPDNVFRYNARALTNKHYEIPMYMKHWILWTRVRCYSPVSLWLFLTWSVLVKH